MREGEGAHDAGALIEEGRRVLAIEAAALTALRDRIGEDFARACGLVAGAKGRVLCCGIGKSGHVARKVAGTLTSTGTPAIFLHPVEALHGDLGIVGRDDVALLVSKSGDVSEVGGLIEFLVRMGVPIVALVGAVPSRLAAHATVTLDCSVEEEACPLDLAPTSSTTAALAMGDALAIAVLQIKGFRAEDFAALHPSGALGRKLSIRVAEVMVSDSYPRLGLDATMRDSIAPLAEQADLAMIPTQIPQHVASCIATRQQRAGHDPHRRHVLDPRVDGGVAAIPLGEHLKVSDLDLDHVALHVAQVALHQGGVQDHHQQTEAHRADRHERAPAIPPHVAPRHAPPSDPRACHAPAPLRPRAVRYAGGRSR